MVMISLRFSRIVGTDGFIDGSAAVQVIDDKMPQLFLFFSDNADPPFYIVVKDKMVQDDAVKISSQYT